MSLFYCWTFVHNLTLHAVYYGTKQNWLIRETYEPPHGKTNKMTCAPTEDAGQPGHPPSLIRVFAVRMKEPWVLSFPFSAQRRLWSDLANAQADLSLRWAHMPFCWFCHEEAHIHTYELKPNVAFHHLVLLILQYTIKTNYYMTYGDINSFVVGTSNRFLIWTRFGEVPRGRVVKDAKL